MTLAEYFAKIFQLIQALAGVRIERYEEQLLSATRGNLRLRLRFADQALLDISEAVVCTTGTLQWLSYRYHYQEPSGFVLRYDNAPHHSEVATHPDHKHVGEAVLASSHPTIAQVLLEVQALRDRQR
jgi:Family of unknown function (DUF6516)